MVKDNSEDLQLNTTLKDKIQKYHSAILSACPTKNLPNVDDLGKPLVARPLQPMMVPTAAALKMGLGFPLTNSMSSGRMDGDRILTSQAMQVQGNILKIPILLLFL